MEQHVIIFLTSSSVIHDLSSFFREEKIVLFTIMHDGDRILLSTILFILFDSLMMKTWPFVIIKIILRYVHIPPEV